MAYLEHIQTYVPERLVPLESLQEKLGLNKYQVQMMVRIHGIQTVAMDEALPLSNLVGNAIRGLLEREPQLREQITAIVYCHTIQTVAPFPKNLLVEWQNEFGLEHALAFSMTMQNCASGIGVLEVARHFLKSSSRDTDKVLVLTGEKAFSRTVQLIPGVSVMGEAATACVVAKQGERNALLAVEEITLGQFSNGVRSTPEQLREFQETYTPVLSQTIRGALAKASLTLDDVAFIAPHNINLSSWKRAAKEMEFPVSKIYLKNVARYGHCFCSDTFLNLADLEKDGLLRKGDNVVLVSVGLGATFGAAVIRH